nr:hypothetical protein Iba_chr01fCG7350 [Ipomoea batatas]
MKNDRARRVDTCVAAFNIGSAICDNRLSRSCTFCLGLFPWMTSNEALKISSGFADLRSLKSLLTFIRNELEPTATSGVDGDVMVSWRLPMTILIPHTQQNTKFLNSQ